MRKLTRKDKTTLLYVLICVGTAASAFLCVLVSSLLLKAEERRLYDRPAFESFSLESGTAVGAPLSLSTRVQLFDATQTEGKQRYPLPDELTEAEANAVVLAAWNQLFMDMMAQAGPDQELHAAIDGADSDVHTSASLRDYLTDDGSRYSLWCGQAWLDLNTGDAFSLTMYLDSRTGQPIMASAVLYPLDAPLLGLGDMAARLGLGYDLSSAESVLDESGGLRVTLPLSGGFALVKTISPDSSRFTIRLTTP
ncbi:MAG: hypothetical protein IJQ45_01670 [Clostridia bacterium]|nr:hypothetical protein [Clostridia bacterium]